VRIPGGPLEQQQSSEGSLRSGMHQNIDVRTKFSRSQTPAISGVLLPKVLCILQLIARVCVSRAQVLPCPSPVLYTTLCMLLSHVMKFLMG
jgi:hypothetical protein